MRVWIWVWVAAALTGCNAGDDDARTVLVFAASSLTDVFRDLEVDFEGLHPGVDAQVSFAGSQALRLQIERGAPADVFASANRDHIDSLHRAGMAGEPTILAHNEMVLIVPDDNPAQIREFADLPRATRLVLCASSVPAGEYAQQVLDRAAQRWGEEFAQKVRSRVVSEESSVRMVRARVELGEADAALVYATDALAMPRVQAIPIPPELNVEANCVFASVGLASDRPEVSALLQYLRSEAARVILRRHGFRIR